MNNDQDLQLFAQAIRSVGSPSDRHKDVGLIVHGAGNTSARIAERFTAAGVDTKVVRAEDIAVYSRDVKTLLLCEIDYISQKLLECLKSRGEAAVALIVRRNSAGRILEDKKYRELVGPVITME